MFGDYQWPTANGVFKDRASEPNVYPRMGVATARGRQAFGTRRPDTPLNGCRSWRRATSDQSVSHVLTEQSEEAAEHGSHCVHTARGYGMRWASAAVNGSGLTSSQVLTADL